MAFRKIILLIPLRFNDGTEIPKGVHARIRADFFREFGGSTVQGTVSGEYRMDSGQKCAETLMQIWVVVQDDQVPVLEALVEEYCGLLKQESIYWEEVEANVRFVRPKSPGAKNGNSE